MKGDFNQFWSDKNYFSDDLKDLLNKMWALNPQERPSIKQIFLHPWVSKKIDTNLIFLKEIGVYQLLFEDSEEEDKVSTGSQTLSEPVQQSENVIEAPERIIPIIVPISEADRYAMYIKQKIRETYRKYRTSLRRGT